MKEQRDFLQDSFIAAAKNLLKYWLVIVFSVIFCVGIAFFYLRYAANEYFVQTSILLEVDGTSNTFGGSTDVLRAFSFMLRDKKFRNEVFFLQSYPLVREVVQELDYRVAYYMQKKNVPPKLAFSKTNIYNDSPFMVVPREDHVQPTGILFHVQIIDENRYRISAFEKDGVSLLDISNERVINYNTSYELDGIFEFGSQIENEKSSFSLTLNSGFNSQDHIGRDFFFRFNNFHHLTSQFKAGLKIDAVGIESTLVNLRIKTENIRLGITFLEKLVSK